MAVSRALAAALATIDHPSQYPQVVAEAAIGTAGGVSRNQLTVEICGGDLSFVRHRSSATSNPELYPRRFHRHRIAVGRTPTFPVYGGGLGCDARAHQDAVQPIFAPEIPEAPACGGVRRSMADMARRRVRRPSSSKADSAWRRR